MKKPLLILTLSIFPALVLAGSGHWNGRNMQDMQGKHDMSQMSNGMQDMEGMSHDEHAGATGRPGDPAKVDRTVDITMDDTMRFNPDRISVKAGDTIRFFLRNDGGMPHEMVIGTLDELKEHAEMMRKMPDMQHAEPNMIRLAPGQRGGIVWQFDQPGTISFACLVPGHMEAGMVGKVAVE